MASDEDMFTRAKMMVIFIGSAAKRSLGSEKKDNKVIR